MNKHLHLIVHVALLLVTLLPVRACSDRHETKVSDGIGDRSLENASDDGADADESLVNEPTVNETLTLWLAGKSVTQEDIDRFGGVDRCFGVDTISDTLLEKMQGKSYIDNPYIGRKDLPHLRVLHWDYDQKIHVGEMVVNQLIADKVVTVLSQLYKAKYPIARMVLPEEYDVDDERQMRDNNSSGFCYRTVARTGKLSKHALGLAVDINTLYNPYYKDRPDGTRFIQPATADQYCDRTKELPYKIDHNDLSYQLFREAGFRWCGDFRSCKDYKNFEFIEHVANKPEVSETIKGYKKAWMTGNNTQKNTRESPNVHITASAARCSISISQTRAPTYATVC